MKIKDLKTFLVNANHPDKPWTDRPRGRIWLFVKLYTDDGIIGLGEAGGWPWVTNTAIQELKTFVIGKDPFNVESLWCEMHNILHGHGITGVVGYGAISGIDMALWDILGKSLKVPLYKLLGGKCRDKIRLYVHANDGKTALALREQGYTAFKLGAEDLSSVKKVKDIRDVLGYDVDVAVDCHAKFAPKAAIKLAKKLERYEILWLEEPTPPESYMATDALARVSNNVDVPIMAGERLFNKWAFRELLDREIVDIINPEITRVGLTEEKKICSMAEAHYVSVSPHDGSAGPIAKIANIHLMAAIPNFLILEHQAADPKWREEIATPLEVREGYTVVPEKPGLGVELNEDEIAKHPPLPLEAIRYRFLSPEETWLPIIPKA